MIVLLMLSISSYAIVGIGEKKIITNNYIVAGPYARLGGDAYFNTLNVSTMYVENTTISNQNVTGTVNAYAFSINGTLIQDFFVDVDGDTMAGQLNMGDNDIIEINNIFADSAVIWDNTLNADGVLSIYTHDASNSLVITVNDAGSSDFYSTEQYQFRSGDDLFQFIEHNYLGTWLSIDVGNDNPEINSESGLVQFNTNINVSGDIRADNIISASATIGTINDNGTGTVKINDNLDIYGSLIVNSDGVWNNYLTIYGQNILFDWFPPVINYKIPNTLGVNKDAYLYGATEGGIPVISFYNSTPPSSQYLGNAHINTQTGEIVGKGISISGSVADSNYAGYFNGDIHMWLTSKIRFGWETSYIYGDTVDLFIVSGGDLDLSTGAGGDISLTISDDYARQTGDNEIINIGGAEFRTIDEPSTETYKLGVTRNGNNIFNNNLTVKQNLSVYKDLDVGGNFTGNQIYGEIWNYTEGGFTFSVASSGIYYNFTGLECGDLNGFDCTKETEAKGGTYLTTKKAGRYLLNLHISGEGSTAGGLYGVIISRNFEQVNNRDCYIHIDGTTNAEVISITCIKQLSLNDKINIQVDDETDPPKDFTIYSANLNALRIGD